VRHEVVRAHDQGRQLGPDGAEPGLLGDVLPGDAVQPGEPEAAARRPDQAVADGADAAALDRDQPERAGAVRPGVGRLEVDRDQLSAVSTRETDRGPSRTEDGWFIVAPRERR
jgi:hypothetical protein